MNIITHRKISHNVSFSEKCYFTRDIEYFIVHNIKFYLNQRKYECKIFLLFLLKQTHICKKRLDSNESSLNNKPHTFLNSFLYSIGLILYTFRNASTNLLTLLYPTASDIS